MINLETVMLTEKPISEVWDLFTDINSISACVPTCKKFEVEDNNTVQANLQIKLGLIPLDSKATVRIVQREPMRRIVAEGLTEAGDSLKKYGRIVNESNTKIQLKLDLEPVNEMQTRIYAHIQAEASGQLKRVYEAIIKGQREKLEAEFVKNVERALGAKVIVERSSVEFS